MSRRCALMTVGLVLAVTSSAWAQTTPTPYIYWTEPDTSSIKRQEAYDPEALPEDIAVGQGSPRGIAYVRARHSLFFADSTFGFIIELSYVTGQGNIIFEGDGAPGGLTGTTNPAPMILWTHIGQSHRVRQCDLSDPALPTTDLVTTGLGDPRDLYVDTLHELIYIADGDAGNIKVTDLAGITNPDPFIPHTCAVTAIAGITDPDPYYPMVFFGDELGSVWRADLDFTGPEPAVDAVTEIRGGLLAISGLAIDEDNDMLWVADGAIWNMDFVGGNLTAVVFSNDAHGITYVSDFVDAGPGDVDLDGDIDLDDYGTVAGCLSGPTTAYPPGCVLCDFDGDGDVDLSEFATFMVSYTGP